jgi:hypothetical protein
VSQVEDDAKDFLKRVVWSLTLGILWLVTNIGIGAYNDLFTPTGTVGNIIFYCWNVISLVALIWINWRIWKKKFPQG